MYMYIATAKDSCQMRWHPLMICWCMYLKLLSSASYHALKTSGFIKLLSEWTLRDYTNYFQSKPSFQQEVNHRPVATSFEAARLIDWRAGNFKMNIHKLIIHVRSTCVETANADNS